MSEAHARSTDPDTSKDAATRATKSMPRIRKAVLEIVADHGMCIGSEINQYYVADDRQKHAGWDSPRKRAGELVKDGYLTIVGRREGESEYCVTFEGWQFLNGVAA